jgi:recombination associated protein RdgC
MPFDNGTVTLTIFRLPMDLPENVLELLHAARAGMLDSVKDEPVYGWVSGRHLLESDINEETAICGGHIYVNLRKAERKIPTQLMTAICRREELVYMQANDCTVVPRKVKRQIKMDAIEKHLMKMPPTLTATPLVVDRTSNYLYLGTASNAQIDDFISKFIHAVGIEPHQVNPEYIMEHELKSTSFDLPELVLTSEKIDDGMPAQNTPARDFLTWLWFAMETDDNMVQLEDLGDFFMMPDGPLTFVYDDAAGAAETTIKKGGSPLRSAEAKAALKVGKKLKKAKILLARDTQIWSCTFDADKFAFSGLTLPEGEAMNDVHAVFEERITNIDIFRQAFTAFFIKYVETVQSDDWSAKEAELIKWAEERDSC